MPDLLTLPEPDLMVARRPDAPTVYPYQRALDAAVRQAVADILLKAPLASPAFTGNPTAPTPLPGDNDTSVATTAFVAAAIAAAPSGGITSLGVQAASSGTTVVFTGIPSWTILKFACAALSHNAGGGANQQLRIELSTNNGSSWGTATNLFTTAVAAGVSGSGVVELHRTASGHVFQAGFLAQALGGLEGTTGVVDAARFSWSLGGSFDDLNGTITGLALN